MNPSLLLIPDRYKASKLYSQIPDSGAGDLAFTRANDTATRVNSAGLIEKVRTNQVLQSETFNDAYWNKINVSITANAIANPLNGALTADLATVTDPSGPVEKTIVTARTQSFTAGTPYTASAYFKAGSVSTNFRILAFDGTSLYQSGVIDLATIGNSTALYEDVGGGWYRFRFTFTPANTTAVGFVYFVNYAFGVAANAGTNVYVYGAQIEAGDIATPYIPTTTAAVSVGPVANIPRIDYTGGGCGKLLLEPQRTNLTQYSEQLNNAYWNKTGSTATANAIVSPDGFQNADLLTESATTADHAFFDVVTYFVSGTTYTLSFFAKANGRTKVEVTSGNSNTCPKGRFDLVAQTAVGVDGSFNAKIENYGNGWFRCSVSRVAPNTGLDVPYHALVQSFGTLTYAGDGTSGMYFWGMQTEAGSYVSSYIPTLGASVTRSADSASKTGISSLIGQASGTIFIEVDAKVFSQMPISSEHRITMVSDNTNNNRILVDFIVTSGGVRRIGVNVISGNVSQANLIFNTAIDKVYKIATAYNTNDFTLFVDGVERATDVSGVTFSGTTLSRLDVGQDRVGTLQQSNPIVAAAIYPTRLSNAELATLTTL